DNVNVALEFDNKKDALDILDSVRLDPEIVVAAVYDKGGTLYAVYPTNFTHLPKSPLKDGMQGTMRTIEVVHPVVSNDSRIGTLYIQSNLKALYSRLVFYVVVALAIIIVSIGATIAFSNRT